MAIYPWKEYDDDQWDIKSFEDYRDGLKEKAEIINYLAEKYDIDCKFAATLGMDVWQREWPNATIRAQGYEIGLDVLKDYNLTGVFLHIWASEPDHLGIAKKLKICLIIDGSRIIYDNPWFTHSLRDLSTRAKCSCKCPACGKNF